MNKITHEEWLHKQEELKRWREEMRKMTPAPKKRHKVNPQEQAIKLLEISKGKVLDVGCGGGASKQWLREVEWKGIDPFPPENHTPDITVGMAEELPFTDDSFDFVICFASLFHLLDPQKAIKEMVRVGGKVGIMTLIWKGGEASAVHTYCITEKLMEKLLKRLNWSRVILDYDGSNPCYLYTVEEK